MAGGLERKSSSSTDHRECKGMNEDIKERRKTAKMKKVGKQRSGNPPTPEPPACAYRGGCTNHL